MSRRGSGICGATPLWRRSNTYPGARFGRCGALLGGDAAGSLAAIWACPEVGACLGSASFRSIVPGFTGPLHAETTATSWGST